MSLKGFRDHITSVLFGHTKDDKPVILSQHGQTTEGMRLQAALNMRIDPEVKARVEEALIRQMGSIAKGMIEARRRYPEAYSDGK
jgi:hypothetical protein